MYFFEKKKKIPRKLCAAGLQPTRLQGPFEVIVLLDTEPGRCGRKQYSKVPFGVRIPERTLTDRQTI